MSNICELINKKRIYFDGGMGTVLQNRGLKSGELPELWNIEHPDIIESVHREYLEAGANIVTTNTFGVNCLKHENYENLIISAIQCAKNAVGDRKDAFVAFDIGPLGRFLEPIGDLPFETAVEIFAKNVRVAAKHGADLIIIETFTDSYETKAAVLAAKENCELPIFVTNVYGEDGKLLTGASVEAMVAMLEGLGVWAIGANCSLGPDKMLPIIQKFSECASIPIIANSNAGLPIMVNGKSKYTLDAYEFSKHARALAEGGANILGGCCGTEPEYIRAVVNATLDIPLNETIDKGLTVVSSYTHAVTVGNSPILIGERINPTGKPRLKQALINGDVNYVLEQGLNQADAGAHILDVNVGLPDINETEAMAKIVTALQSVCDLPLQLDSGDSKTLEASMRLYNGKPLINSVNGDEESMASIFSLVKKYGGTVIALTLDKNGIPKSADERVNIAERILTRAKEYGISEKDLIFDPLALTIATDPSNANITLEAIKTLTSMGLKTSLGVSNVSFGMPQRDKINASFFAKALKSGLSCAIMNPSSLPMKNVYDNCIANGRDNIALDDFETHITNRDTSAITSIKSLKEAIVKGLTKHTAKMTEELLKNSEPLHIINSEIIPALDEVGKGFENHTVYLPQLLRSAECSSKAFALIKEKMPSEESNGNSVIIATVKGDIHDIGKNIVKLLLESHGFTVHDLGKDVPAEAVIEAIKKYGPRLVALSALMTTTLPAMEGTLKMIREYDENIKVMVGGAVLTESYAKSIGADAYGKDAMAAVRYAKQIYSK